MEKKVFETTTFLLKVTDQQILKHELKMNWVPAWHEGRGCIAMCPTGVDPNMSNKC